MRDITWAIIIACIAFLIGFAVIYFQEEQAKTPKEQFMEHLEAGEVRIVSTPSKEDLTTGQSIDPKLETPKLEDFLPNETKGFTHYKPEPLPEKETKPLASTGDTKLNEAIESSVNMAKERDFAYNFSCGYEIDGILIHEGIPRYGNNWWGFAMKDRIVIKEGLSDRDKMGVFAHEMMHYTRMQNGSFNPYNLEEEERLAYLHGWNESNWDERITRHRCIR